jgi:hypothetical protein
MTGTILIGPAASGKSRVAELMSLRESVTKIDGRAFNKSASNIDSIVRKSGNANYSPTLMIFDDVPVKALHRLLDYMLSSWLPIERRGEPTKAVTPKIIITVDCSYEDVPSSSSYIQRFNMISCVRSNDHDIEMIMHHPVERDPVFAF